MPSSVSSLLASVNLEPAGCVPWETPVPETATGVYIVSLSASPTEITGTYATAPISEATLDRLISISPHLELDGIASPTREQLADRIGSYWLADECVLYIGMAGQPLRTRVRQYYKTPIGAAKPHRGGWWLKTLSVLEDLHVHYASTPDFRNAEESMMRTFAADVTDASRGALVPGEPVMPFANLRDGDWRRRNHRIKNA